MTDTACEDPGTYTFSQVAGHANLADALGDGSLCVDGNQYIYMLDGQTYPTCVHFANPEMDCVDDLVCTTGTGVAGFYGGQASYVADAITRRNDHKHQDCPTIQESCSPLPTWWRTQFLDSGISEDNVNNICVPDTFVGDACYVMENGMQRMCVGFNRDSQAACPEDPMTDTYLCGGVAAGTQVFGWPGSITNMIALALGEDSLKHPQCRY